MTQNVARSERMLKGMGDKLGLTEPGRQWLMCSVDPFHDTPLNCTGLPDTATGNSVTQTIKQSITIDCPSGVTTGTWDAYMVSMPWITTNEQPIKFTATNSNEAGNTYCIDSLLNGRSVGSFNIVYGATGPLAGTASDPFNPAYADSTSNWNNTQLNLAKNFVDGDYRVISSGFEVINTSPELNVSGLVTTWRSPVPSLQNASAANAYVIENIGVTGTLYATYSHSALNIDIIPITIAEAMLLPNTKQWKAKDGCYVVSRFNDLESIIQNSNYTQPIIHYPAGPAQLDPDQVPIGVVRPVNALPTGVTVPNIRPTALGVRQMNWTCMDICGAYFTGMDIKTSLTITWIVTIERFPSKQEADLIVLAKPSPEYDPVAMEMYKAMVQHLPTGVPQYENGLGDWFRDAISTVAETVSPVLSVIPHPYAQAASKVVGAVGNASRRQEPVSTYQAHPTAKQDMSLKKEVKKEKKELKKIESVMPHKKKAGKK